MSCKPLKVEDYLKQHPELSPLREDDQQKTQWLAERGGGHPQPVSDMQVFGNKPMDAGIQSYGYRVGVF